MNGWNKSDWFGFLGIVLALIGLGTSFYFYKLSVKEREPVLLEESFRPLLVAADSIKNSPLKVVNADGSVINKDLSSLRYYFFNKGGESIRQSNILKPIQLELASNSIQIIDVKLLATSRPEIVNPKIGLSKDRPHSVDMGFDILEKDDGFSVEVLYAGAHTAPLVLHGAIEGVQRIETNQDLASYQYYKSLMWKIGAAFLGTLFMTIPLIFPLRFIHQKPISWRLKMIASAYAFAVVFLVITFPHDAEINKKVELSARKNILDIVPLNIKSETGSVIYKDSDVETQ